MSGNLGIIRPKLQWRPFMPTILGLFLMALTSVSAFAQSEQCPVPNSELKGVLQRLYERSHVVVKVNEIPGKTLLRSFWMSKPDATFQDMNCGTDGFYKVAVTSINPEGLFLSYEAQNVFIPLKEEGLNFPTNPYGNGINCKVLDEIDERIVVCYFNAGLGRLAYSCFSNTNKKRTKCLFEDEK